jgi:AcrR family transcriptional regulator
MTTMSYDRVVIFYSLCYTLLVRRCKVPKDTFINLPDAKRKAVFDAAVKEFSVHMFSEASINRIVKAAEIARGSFYQYFESKEDLFSYVIARIFTEIEEIMQKRLIDLSDADALSLFMEKVYATVELNNKKPEYTRITFIQSKDETPFVESGQIRVK